MARRRDSGTTRAAAGAAKKRRSNAAAVSTTEQRVLDLAEQLGRIVGTVQAKAEGWMDRDRLSSQIASVRDGAAELLEHLSDGVKKVSTNTSVAPVSPTPNRGRSGGVVDAPGKKHRKPLPRDPDANSIGTQAARLRMAKTMVKTNRRRGRG
jgi:hypothetical protein